MSITIPLTLETVQQHIIKPWKRLRASVAGKNQNHEKIANTLIKLPKFVILKS